MKCPLCQQDNPPQAKFCLECAAPLVRRCSGCGTELPPIAKFCFECAKPVDGPAASPARFATPAEYTPKHLAERIINSKAAIEGERKFVTVLFADMKGSTELLADRDPEEARRLLDPVLEHMMEAVHRYDGTVNQVMGDGIMALFGAPIGHEDHAVRACYAALRMQRRVSLYADELQQQGGTPVQIRVGVNSGEVVVRAIGSDLHMDYTAVGQTTHLAARMEQMAKPGSSLVSGETLKLVEGYVQIRALGAVAVKGLEAPTLVYELVGAVATRSRLQTSVARGLSRFVGRDREVEQLSQALERAAAGHGQAVAVVGEAGVGKSRLAWEFTRSHRTQGWLVLESSSVSYGKATPYLPVIELLKAYCRIQERDDHREIRERVAGKVLALDRALEPIITPLLVLLDVPVDDAAWAALDRSQRRQRTLDAVKRLLLRESRVQPVILVFEDLHWIDAETQVLLDSLMESLPTARVLLLVNYRPEYQHGWGGKMYYLQLRIDPLRPESSEEFLDALLGGHPTLEPLKHVLIERTQGNPFFLEESVRALVETHVLIGERGAYRVTTSSRGWQIPPTVQAILGARIDRLQPEDKRLLQAAAVIGKDVAFALLLAIADVPEDTLRRALQQLQAAEFLYETSLFPDLEYTFKHAFTHEVAYGSVLHERRRILHARIADAIEQIYSDRLAEHVERLAHHGVRGEVWQQAVTYCRWAGAKAFARSANKDAVAHYEEALRLQQRLPQSRARDEQAIDLRFDLRSALMVLGDFKRTLEVLREAENLARMLDDVRRIGWAAGYLCNLLWEMGEQDEAIARGQEALDISVTVNDADLRYLALRYLGRSYHAIGEYRRGVEMFRRALATVEETRGIDARPNPAANSSRHFAALCFMELGAFREAIAYAEGALSALEGVDQPFNLAGSSTVLGYVHLRRGHIGKAIPLLERGLQLCETYNFRVLLPFAASPLGAAYAFSNRIEDALALLEQAVKQAASMRRLVEHSLQVAWHSEVLLLANRVEDAKESADRALDLALAHKERGYQGWSLRLLGEIHLARVPREFDKSEAFFQQALALGDELAMDPLRAHCQLGLGAAYEQMGRRQEACVSLTNARALYRAMEMSFWLPRTEAALVRLGAQDGPDTSL